MTSAAVRHRSEGPRSERRSYRRLSARRSGPGTCAISAARHRRNWSRSGPGKLSWAGVGAVAVTRRVRAALSVSAASIDTHERDHADCRAGARDPHRSGDRVPVRPWPDRVRDQRPGRAGQRGGGAGPRRRAAGRDDRASRTGAGGADRRPAGPAVPEPVRGGPGRQHGPFPRAGRGPAARGKREGGRGAGKSPGRRRASHRPAQGHPHPAGGPAARVGLGPPGLARRPGRAGQPDQAQRGAAPRPDAEPGHRAAPPGSARAVG